MAPKKSSSSGCEPAVMPNCEMVVTWYGKRKRKLRSLTVEVPLPVLERFLRGAKSPGAMQSPPPAIRRRRRTGRKGKGCGERRKWARDCGTICVQEHDEGTVEFVDSMGASGSQGDCASVALGLGSSVEASDGDVLTSAVGSAEVIVEGLGAAAAVSGSVVALADSVSCEDAAATLATPDYEESIKAMGPVGEIPQ